MASQDTRIVSHLRGQFQGAHMFLEGTMADVTPDQAHWAPPGTALPISAQYAHIVTAEDGTINGMFRGGAPLFASSWAGKTGLNQLPPPAQNFDWADWAHQVRIELPTLRQYAQAAYAATDEFLASLTDEDLNRPLDLSTLGVGQQTMGWMLNTLMNNVSHHCGEIACLKGLQGAKGYPM